MKRRKIAEVAAATVMLGGGLALATAPAADAADDTGAPSSCRAWVSGNTAYAQCWGSGRYSIRAGAVCRDTGYYYGTTFTTWGYVRSGGSGVLATSTCRSNSVAVGARVQVL